MKLAEQQRALRVAVEAARNAGAIMTRNFHAPKKINSSTQHDIKLELDERCQRRIEALLERAFPSVSILGEEGVRGDSKSDHRWVVDPIDGTVNFTYGIPHACVSIALQERSSKFKVQSSKVGRVLAKASGTDTVEPSDGEFQSLVGVVYDPFCDELFTGLRGQPARLNGRRLAVSQRSRLDEAIVSIGFSKTVESLNQMLPAFGRLVHRVRKLRIMGAAALSLAYVASGRMDGYVESGLRLWDIAAGGLIVECAGGDFWHEPLAGQPHTYRILVNNGRLRRSLAKLVKGEKS
jgi:myo-inositol-1(or 4)-monophosphatase